MGDVRVYALDWYFSLRQRLEREHEGVLVVPPFEYKCNVFADLVFSVCGRLGLDRHPEVKYKALQYFEKTVEVKLADAGHFCDVDVRSPEVAACVWVAAKEVTTVDLPALDALASIFPQTGTEAVVRAEKTVLRCLKRDLGKPDVYSCVEVLLGVLEVPPATLRTDFMATADHFLALLAANKYTLFKKVFRKVHDRDPESADDIFQLRVMMRDQIFQASSAVLATGCALGLDTEALTRKLTLFTGITSSTQHFVAKILLKGVRDYSR